MQRAESASSVDPSASPQSPFLRDASSHACYSARSSPTATIYRTTGLDAQSSPMLNPGGSGAPALNPRSCVTCRRRKVRCDKQMPCSNCRRALVSCIFPAPGRAPRRPRPRDPNASPKRPTQGELELIGRLKKLESIVGELSGQLEGGAGTKFPSSVSSPDHPHTGAAADDGHSLRPTAGAPDRPAATSQSPRSQEPDPGDGIADESVRRNELQARLGRLVLDDSQGTSRYVTGGLWSKLNDELQAIRGEMTRFTDEEALDSDYEESPRDTDSPSSVHHDFILGYQSTNVNLREWHPSPAHVAFLWSVYQENVEPLIKILHVPTTDAIIRQARHNYDTLTPGHQALVFAIYFAAITSLEPDEVQTNFGIDKPQLIANYRFALEQALAKARFLETSDLSVVRAFTLFLIVVRRNDDTRFCWALSGLLTRIARGLGLHRDGTQFGLSPYDTEMRRRIWWSILLLDLQCSDEHGSDYMINENDYDTQTPSNINDADLSPDKPDPPIIQSGRSDCAVFIVRCEIFALSRKFVYASTYNTPDKISLAEKERTLDEVYQRIENKFLQHVLDESDPLYWAAAVIVRVIMAKVCVHIYHPLLFPGSDFMLSAEVRQRLYIASIEIIDYNVVLNSDPRCRPYRWLFGTFPHWLSFAYILIETCRRPWTALVERGWESVRGYYSNFVQIERRADHAAVFLPLRKLLARASKHRQSEIDRLRANPEEARRLDVEERMNPIQARFGPVPGTEKKMEQTREKWNRMMQLGRDGPMSLMTARRQSVEETSLASDDLLVKGMQQRQDANFSKPPGDNAPSPDTYPPQDGLGLMGDLMSSPMVDLDNALTMNGGPGYQGVESTSAVAGPRLQGPVMGQDPIQQQSSGLASQPPSTGSLFPVPWAETFPIVDAKLEEALGRDTDMLGEDFDWQNWSQSLRGLDMESSQIGERW